MSLPSQSARTTPAGRSFVYKRKRRRQAPAAVVIGAAAVVLVALSFVAAQALRGLSGPAEANAADVETLATSGAPTRDSTTHAVTAETVVIDQGIGVVQSPEPARNASEPSPVQSQPDSAGPLWRAVDGAQTAPGRLNGAAPDPLAEATESLRDAPAVTPDSSIGRALERARSPVQERLAAAEARIAAGDPLGAREILTRALSLDAEPLELALVRQRLTALNDDLVFGPRVVEGDPVTEAYVVQSGDSLARIAKRRALGVHHDLLARVNGLDNPNRIRLGQRLKLVRGPFHAVVDKSAYRLDLYHGPASDRSSWTYVRSFPVGLGEGDSTPVGRFIVRENGKLKNPSWVNPRRPSEKYTADDPDNPIGERWIGLDGLGDDAIYVGYGLHGTIEPGSIGRQASMGCVRLLAPDVELMYECLSEGESVVVIEE